MKRSELSAMTIAALNTLAKKNSVKLPAQAKKEDIINAIMGPARPAKASKKKAVTAKPAKTAAGKSDKKIDKPKKSTAPGKTAAKKNAVIKTAVKKAVTKKAVAKKAASKKRVIAKKAPAVKRSVREWKLPPGTEEPLLAQERVADSKYYTGPDRGPSMTGTGELPQAYHEDKIAILSRDPYVAYAYWEATPARIEREKTWFGWDSKLCIRIYDITGVNFDGRNATGYYDQEVDDRIGSWYFDFGRPTHSFCADFGLLSPEGRFLTIVRSNYITMPRDGISDVIDEEWMLVDEEFWKLYGYPEGFRQGVSSPEMQEMLKRRRSLDITSPGMFSRERAKRK